MKLKPIILAGVALVSLSAYMGAANAVNSDQVKGTAKEATGAVKEKYGKVTGNKKVQTKGAIEKNEGKVQKGYGDVKQKAADTINK